MAPFLLMVIPILVACQTRIDESLVNRPPILKSFGGMNVIGLLAGLLVGNIRARIR